jgi:hypothetical protein
MSWQLYAFGDKEHRKGVGVCLKAETSDPPDFSADPSRALLWAVKVGPSLEGIIRETQDAGGQGRPLYLRPTAALLFLFQAFACGWRGYGEHLSKKSDFERERTIFDEIIALWNKTGMRNDLVCGTTVSDEIQALITTARSEGLTVGWEEMDKCIAACFCHGWLARQDQFSRSN